MKKIISSLLCAVMLITLCSCAKEVDLAKQLPDTIWDNHASYISIEFKKDGACIVSNAISTEDCTYIAEDDKLTITGVISTWQGVLTKDSITIDGMEGSFTKAKERTYFPATDNYGYVIGSSDDEIVEDVIHDLSFWHGTYKSTVGELTIGESGILNTLTYMIKLDSKNIISGTIRPSGTNTMVLENSNVRITLMQLGALVEAVDSSSEIYAGSYIKQ